MTLEEINGQLQKLESSISEMKAMVADANNCQSEKAKSILVAAVSKLMQPFMPPQA